MRALIIEDDPTIADFVVGGLREAGFVVDHAADGTSGLDLARAGGYDVAIVDLMLPGIDGMTLIQTMRRDGIQTPVLILSARQTVNDIISAGLLDDLSRRVCSMT